jgi:hypothetical protein
LPLLSFDRFKQSGFLATNVGTSSAVDSNIEFKITAGDRFAKISRGIGFVYGRLQNLYLGGIFTANIDIGSIALDGVATDDNTFDQAMRVADENISILKGRRLGFIGVNRKIHRFIDVFGQKAPFKTGRESSTTAAS